MNKYLLLLTFIFTAVLSKGQVVVEAHLDTANILIGEQVELRVKCSAGAKQQIEFPYFQPQQEIVKGVEVVNNSRIDTLLSSNGQRIELTRRYTITAFDSALYRIPPISIKVDGKDYLSRGNIGLKVSTVAVDTVHVDKFFGPHDVVDMPFVWSWRTTCLSLLAILMAVITLCLTIRRTDPRLITRRIVVHPPTPAHVTALNDIERIKSNAMPDAKAYYMNLTEALRTYLSSRFGFNAKEMTTQEIIDELTANENEEALSELKDILVTADLVKFAKHKASLSEQDRNLVQALDYVKATKLEPKELPQPHVEYETLSGKRQHQMRVAMTIGAWLAGIVAVLLTAYILYDLYSCYGSAF